MIHAKPREWPKRYYVEQRPVDIPKEFVDWKEFVIFDAWAGWLENKNEFRDDFPFRDIPTRAEAEAFCAELNEDYEIKTGVRRERRARRTSKR
jgi:hypothetical protein